MAKPWQQTTIRESKLTGGWPIHCARGPGFRAGLAVTSWAPLRTRKTGVTLNAKTESIRAAESKAVSPTLKTWNRSVPESVVDVTQVLAELRKSVKPYCPALMVNPARLNCWVATLKAEVLRLSIARSACLPAESIAVI